MSSSKTLVKPLATKNIHDMTKAICDETKLSPVVVELVIRKLVEYVISQIFAGNAVKFVGFCTFYIRHWHINRASSVCKLSRLGYSYVPYVMFAPKFKTAFNLLRPSLHEKLKDVCFHDERKDAVASVELCEEDDGTDNDTDDYIKL